MEILALCESRSSTQLLSLSATAFPLAMWHQIAVLPLQASFTSADWAPKVVVTAAALQGFQIHFHVLHRKFIEEGF